MSKANGGGNGAVVDLASALARIERQFGEGSVISIGENRMPEVEAIPTGALSLDLALGVGGLPRGRIVEVYGPESSGKTTLTYHVIAEAQRLGGRCAFIDAEHSMDPAYAAASRPSACRRGMGQALRKLAGNLRQAGATCLFTNQLREKIGVLYGPKETQPGGRALNLADEKPAVAVVHVISD